MRTVNNVLLKITLIALLVPIGSAFAMEYGDMPQSTVVPLTSWLYNKYSASQEIVDHALPVVTIVGAAPTVIISKNVALVIAGSALTLWAARKIFNWMNSKTKNGE